MQTIFDAETSPGQFDHILTGEIVNACYYFDNPDQQPFLKIYMDAFNKYGNKLTTCPIKMTKFDVTGFRIDSKDLPPFTPPGKYKVTITTFRKVDTGFKKVCSFIGYSTVTKE